MLVWAGAPIPGQGRQVPWAKQARGIGGTGLVTSFSRLYLISYLRMSPLGFLGSCQRSKTLFLLAGSQVTLPGMLSASARGQSRRGREVRSV